MLRLGLGFNNSRIKTIKWWSKKRKREKKCAFSNLSRGIEYPCEKCKFIFESKRSYETHLEGIQHNTIIISRNSFVEEVDDDDDQQDDYEEGSKDKC